MKYPLTSTQLGLQDATFPTHSFILPFSASPKQCVSRPVLLTTLEGNEIVLLQNTSKTQLSPLLPSLLTFLSMSY